MVTFLPLSAVKRGPNAEIAKRVGISAPVNAGTQNIKKNTADKTKIQIKIINTEKKEEISG